MSIGQAAEHTGLSTHTLRFYEREGILATTVDRAANGRRQYSEQDLNWIYLCTRLRASGMPLAAIRRYAELVREGLGNEAERLALLRTHAEHVNAQIAELRGCLEIITRKVEMYAERANGSRDPLWDPAESDDTGQCRVPSE